MQLCLEDLDLVQVARDAITHLLDEAVHVGSRIDLVPEAHVAGRWDRIRLGQVVTNLLSNAIKFGRARPITVSVTGDDARARLSVRDEGIGIELADQERVFGRFERAAPTRHFGGLGLGLYIARQIVEAHGGAIELHSVPGAGTTFTVDLPRSPPESAPEGPDWPARPVVRA
jgi:signal transduction histidine kinase